MVKLAYSILDLATYLSVEFPVSGKVVVKKVVLRSNNTNHYAVTSIQSQLYNPAPVPQQSKYSFIIPDGAMITGLTMETEGTKYTAKLKEANSAADTFTSVSKKNSSAIILKVDSSRPSEVQLTANLKGYATVNFTLKYEEYLPLMENAHRQTVKFLSDSVAQSIDGEFSVKLSEKGKHKIQRIEIIDNMKNNKNYRLTNSADSTGIVGKEGFRAKVKLLAKPTRLMNVTADNGKAVQSFQMVYTMKGSNQADTILSREYFAHFFPNKIFAVSPRHVIFVIDVSGSMWGKKLQQTKDTMITLLDSLSDQDYVNIISFESRVYHWPVDRTPADALTHREMAVEHSRNLRELGWTNINGALLEALDVAQAVRKSPKFKPNTEQFIFFMTDGHPTEGVTSSAVIKRNVKDKNRSMQVPIHCLAFGADADFSLLVNLAAENNGKSAR